MKNRFFTFFILAVSAAATFGCSKGKSKSALPDNGQLVGVAPASRVSMDKPKGMVYVPAGTFHMGPSDEDVNFNYTSRNKQVSRLRREGVVVTRGRLDLSSCGWGTPGGDLDRWLWSRAEP